MIKRELYKWDAAGFKKVHSYPAFDSKISQLFIMKKGWVEEVPYLSSSYFPIQPPFYPTKMLPRDRTNHSDPVFESAQKREMREQKLLPATTVFWVPPVIAQWQV